MNNRPKVVIAETIAEAGVKALSEQCAVEMAVGADRPRLVEVMADADGLVVRSATQVDAELIAAAPRLRVIGRAGIGVDNIDLAAATAAGVVVVNAPNANTISAAEHAMALLLAQARNVAQADATTRSGVWDRSRFQGVELHGKTLGVVGLGRIGTLVADRARAFGMRVVAYDPYLTAEIAQRKQVELVGFDQLLAEADFITVHLPRTRETEGLLGREAFSRVKDGVRIVNTSRGGIVDEAALAEAILSGRVGGAGIDVFETEPISDSPLFSLPQVVVTPHLGASTVEAQDKAGLDVAVAVSAALNGELVPSAVNLDVGSEVSAAVREFLPLAEDLGRVFMAIAGELPAQVFVRVEGRLADETVSPLRLAALKGMLSGSTSDPISYVNAPALAKERGLVVDEQRSTEPVDHVSVVRLLGETGAGPVSVGGTVTRKGPTLVEVEGLEIELPLSPHLLIVRNEDTPGLIGRVGTFLGDRGVNIADMVVGRQPGTSEPAMMGLSLDQPLAAEDVEKLRRIDGVRSARFVDLTR